MTNATAILPAAARSLPRTDRPSGQCGSRRGSTSRHSPGYTNLPFRLSIREVGGVGPVYQRPRQRPAPSSKKSRRRATCSPPCPSRAPAVRPDLRLEGARDGRRRDSGSSIAVCADGIDINMGCPVRKVVKTGGGSSLMCDTSGGTDRHGATGRRGRRGPDHGEDADRAGTTTT